MVQARPGGVVSASDWVPWLFALGAACLALSLPEPWLPIAALAAAASLLSRVLLRSPHDCPRCAFLWLSLGWLSWILMLTQPSPGLELRWLGPLVSTVPAWLWQLAWASLMLWLTVQAVRPLNTGRAIPVVWLGILPAWLPPEAMVIALGLLGVHRILSRDSVWESGFLGFMVLLWPPLVTIWPAMLTWRRLAGFVSIPIGALAVLLLAGWWQPLVDFLNSSVPWSWLLNLWLEPPPWQNLAGGVLIAVVAVVLLRWISLAPRSPLPWSIALAAAVSVGMPLEFAALGLIVLAQVSRHRWPMVLAFAALMLPLTWPTLALGIVAAGLALAAALIEYRWRRQRALSARV